MTNTRSSAVVAFCGTFLLGASVAAAPPSVQQRLNELEQQKRVENVFRAYFPNEAAARKAVISLESSIVESMYERGFIIAELTPSEAAVLRRNGFRLEVANDYIEQRNALLSRLQREYQAGAPTDGPGILAIPGYDCYETVEETFAEAQAMAANNPTLATWIDIGDSWERTVGQGGYDLQVLVITNTSIGGDKPRLFIQSALHAREYTTAPLNLAFARWLIDGYGSNADATWIVDHHEVHMLLQANPDGRKRAETGLSWRKNTNQNYCGATSNSRGVDLNRNFTYYWNTTGGVGSSGNQCSNTYRGPSAASEPEVQTIENYVRGLWADRRGPGDNDPAPTDTSGIHLDIHSSGRLLLWPYGHTNNPAPNGVALQTLGRKMAFFNGHAPQQSIGLYPTDGTSDDVSYGELGVAHYTFELGTQFFESCSYYQNTLLPDNLPALIYTAKVIRTPYITPGGPDVTGVSLSGVASTTGVPAGTPVTLSGLATDLRFNNSNGTEPTQDISAAEYYVDVPPWQAGASATALSAADGSFNAPSEALTGVIDTTGLAEGQHTVFVRARDGTATWGAFSAVFLVIDNSAPPDDCLYRATFETGADGWITGNNTCTTGAFVQGTPTQFSTGSIVTQVGGAAEGAGAWFTATNSALGTNDVDGGTCETLSPSINASAESAVEVSLSYFHGQRDAGDDASDGFTVEVLNNGSVVSSLVNIGDVATSAAWTSVSAVVDNPGNLQLRVRATDGSGPGDIVEAGIDGVQICRTTAPPPPPPPPPPPSCALEEGFENGLGGWTNAPSSTCSTGAFIAGTPTQVTNGGVVTQVGGANGGSNALFTASNSSAGVNDVDGGNCIATSPSVGVTADSTLTVAYFHGQRDPGDDANGDFFRLELSTDGGATFSTLASNGDALSNAAWQTATAPIAAGSDVVLRIQCSDGAGAGDLIECGIDDIAICAIP